MQLIRTEFPDVFLIEPEVFGDERGFFLECYNRRELESLGVTAEFVQDNHACSARHVLRGLHYQVRQPQGKLVRAVAGEIFDVAVDLRRSSVTFGRWVGFHLSAANKRLAWIPAGYAHGYLVLSEFAEVLYKATDYYAIEHERSILWKDPELGIIWPLNCEPILSRKDRAGKRFKDAELFT